MKKKAYMESAACGEEAPQTASDKMITSAS